MLTSQAWPMGFGPLNLRRAVGRGQGRPLVKMQLDPPVQTAGENHPADLPGGESRGAEKSEPASVPAKGAPEPGFAPPSAPWGPDQGQVPTQGVWGGAWDSALLTSSQVMLGVEVGTTLRTTSQERYFSHLDGHGSPGDLVMLQITILWPG